MKLLMNVFVSVLILCIVLDLYNLYRDKTEYNNNPKKEAHIALIHRDDIQVYILTDIGEGSIINVENGVVYERYKSIKRPLGRGVDYRILLLKGK